MRSYFKTSTARKHPKNRIAIHLTFCYLIWKGPSGARTSFWALIGTRVLDHEAHFLWRRVRLKLLWFLHCLAPGEHDGSLEVIESTLNTSSYALNCKTYCSSCFLTFIRSNKTTIKVHQMCLRITLRQLNMALPISFCSGSLSLHLTAKGPTRSPV